MSNYISARDAILRELESAEAALKGANEAYASDQRALHAAQRRAELSHEGRARNAKNVDRLEKALAILAEDEEDEEGDEGDDMSEQYTPTTRVYGHGCITLTHYPSSRRLGVVQVGTNAVMDSWELVEFAREAGLLTEHDRQVAERAWDEAVEETHALGWLHDLAKSDALARNPYRAARGEQK